DDAADDCLADILPDAMLHLPTQKEGPSRGRRFDLRLSAGIRVAHQARLETIMTPEDLDPPFARPIDALERLPQRLAMLYECGRHAVVVGKHRSEAQWQHRAGRTGEVVPVAQVDNPVGVDARFGGGHAFLSFRRRTDRRGSPRPVAGSRRARLARQYWDRK